MSTEKQTLAHADTHTQPLYGCFFLENLLDFHGPREDIRGRYTTIRVGATPSRLISDTPLSSTPAYYATG